MGERTEEAEETMKTKKAMTQKELDRLLVERNERISQEADRLHLLTEAEARRQILRAGDRLRQISDKRAKTPVRMQREHPTEEEIALNLTIAAAVQGGFK